jgi:hypothetical protein
MQMTVRPLGRKGTLNIMQVKVSFLSVGLCPLGSPSLFHSVCEAVCILHAGLKYYLSCS